MTDKFEQDLAAEAKRIGLTWGFFLGGAIAVLALIIWQIIDVALGF